MSANEKKRDGGRRTEHPLSPPRASTQASQGSLYSEFQESSKAREQRRKSIASIPARLKHFPESLSLSGDTTKAPQRPIQTKVYFFEGRPTPSPDRQMCMYKIGTPELRRDMPTTTLPLADATIPSGLSERRHHPVHLSPHDTVAGAVSPSATTSEFSSSLSSETLSESPAFTCTRDQQPTGRGAAGNTKDSGAS